MIITSNDLAWSNHIQTTQIQFHRHKGEDQNALLDKMEEEESELDLFVRNLDGDLSWQVNESWINPDSITQENLLGHGEFYGQKKQ